MRLKCNIDVVNRLLPSQNIEKASKPTHGQLSIGRKPGSLNKDGPLYLMLCTAKDRNGAKFVIKGNVEQVFAKFVSDGKATIRIGTPKQDLCLSKADPLQLKNFLSVLRLSMQGKSLDHVTLSSLAPASSKQVEKPKTKMIILNRKDYPLTSNFPCSLTSLQVSHCNMKRIDGRILQLKKMQILDLSENALKCLPEDTGQLSCLQQLFLQKNELSEYSTSFCKGSLQNTLGYLDISNNQLTALPLQICELQALVTLKMDNNLLEHLPPTLGRLVNLKFLSAASNKLTVLPAGFLRLQLETIDLFGNPFTDPTDSDIPLKLDVPNLLELCARNIRKNGLPYDDECLYRHLCRYLDSARQCWCGSYCFQCSVRYVSKIDLNRVAHTVTGLNLAGTTQVAVESYLCSQSCLNRFQKNPFAYWRK